MERLERARIETLLRTVHWGRNLILLERTGSTNDVAKGMAAEGAPEGTVVVAEEQTAGRGRLGRRWVAPPGTCLLCSLLFRPALPLSRANWLTMLTSMAAADAIREQTGLRVDLKWPNDLVVPARGADGRTRAWRKLAGVLTETGVRGERLDFVIVGIGINVNVPPDLLPGLAPDATSVLAETGREADRALLLATFLREVERRYEALWTGKSPYREWAARLATIGKRVRVTTSTASFVGVAEGVDEEGALLLRTEDGICHRLLAGDVTLRPLPRSLDESSDTGVGPPDRRT